MKAWMSSNLGKFETKLLPLIDVRIEFLLNILKTNRPVKTKFCIQIIIDKIYFGIVNLFFFRKLATELLPLIDIRIWYLLNILRTNLQIETKFCINIIIDKIYVGIVNKCFLQICNRVTALD